jgi:preprotein translocase subunit SecB
MSDEGIVARHKVATILRVASSIAERANIRDIRLFETSAELKGFNTAGSMQWDLNVTPVAHYNVGDSYFIVMISYAITIEKADESSTGATDEESEEVATIAFQLGAFYELKSDDPNRELNTDDVDEYAKTTAMVTLYPYAREYVHDITMRMGLPPLVMEFLPFSVELHARPRRDREQQQG